MWLDLVCNPPSTESGESLLVDVNQSNSPRSLKWKIIGGFMRSIRRLGISRSDLVMDVANVEGATPIHLAGWSQ